MQASALITDPLTGEVVGIVHNPGGESRGQISNAGNFQRVGNFQRWKFTGLLVALILACNPVATGAQTPGTTAPGGQDPAFFANASTFVAWGVTLLVGVATLLNALRRKPPVGEDIAGIQHRIATTETAIKRLFAHRDEILDQLQRLNEQRVANGTKLEALERAVATQGEHLMQALRDLREAMDRGELQHTQQLAELTRRIDNLAALTRSTKH